MTEHILILLLTCSKRNNLNCILTQFIHHTGDQIKSLLICQSGYDTDHQLLMVLCKSKLFLKFNFILNLLFPEILYTVIPVNILVCLRIIYIIVDSIHNTGKACRPGLHQSFQLFSVKRSLNFLCIGAADSCHFICIDDTAL